MMHLFLQSDSKYKAFLSAVLAGMLIFCVPDKTLMAQENTAYRFGVFPHMSPMRIENQYAPLALSFSELLKRPVKLGTANGIYRFRERVLNGAFDIALIPPLGIVSIVDEGGFIPLARRKSKPASIVVAEDSVIKQVADLQGKTLGLPEGTPVNIFLQLTLNDQGFVGDKSISFKLFNNVQACLHKLLLKTVDACGIGSGASLNMFQNKMAIKLREIMKTKAFPHMLFVAHPRLPSTERDLLTQAILGEDTSAAVVNIQRMLGNNAQYIPYKKTDYDIIREYRQRWARHAKNPL